MAVVINEFEAVGTPQEEAKKDAADSAPKKIEPAQLAPPLRRIAARHARLSAR